MVFGSSSTTRIVFIPLMLLTRRCRLIVARGGVAVGALVPVLEAPRDIVLLAIAVPATVPVIAAAAPEQHAEQAEEQEQAEQWEQEPEREEPEAPAVSVGMAVIHSRRGTGGLCGLDDGLPQAGVVRADGDEAADDEDRDEGEERTHG